MRIHVSIYKRESDEMIDGQFGSHKEAIDWLHNQWDEQEKEEARAEELADMQFDPEEEVLTK